MNANRVNCRTFHFHVDAWRRATVLARPFDVQSGKMPSKLLLAPDSGNPPVATVAHIL
jgi:hypothetical protein